MWSLPVSALLACACVEVLQAQFYPGFHSAMGMGLGGLPMPFDDTEEDTPTEPLLLNCFASFKDTNGNLDNELAVTIEPGVDEVSVSSSHYRTKRR
ncbi:hypothetical protein ElyMa_002433000 [Elysia marginata]|uniref:Uncharacterized protein n=1 Tax=Elysia marginata TaxID=1093978 RepID=A0AAV4GH60_9GAST|nr:hypothetical protein ElyMa_002433000 [Elysia marginata]